MLLWWKQRTSKYALICPSCVHFVKRNFYKKGVVAEHLLPQSQLSGGTGKFIYKPMIIRQQTAPLKHDRSASYTSAVHH